MVRMNEEWSVPRFLPFRIGMTGALAAVLLLAGCGRKGPLDLPPNTSALQSAPVEPNADPNAPPARNMAKDFDEEGKPIAPAGPKTRQFLDWLLN
jgi:predicted small lipoprotein YifL